jgi:replicative DNA helicase
MADRLPPYSEEAEKAVIGCCLQDPVKCHPESALIVTQPAFFYDARCRSAWEIIGTMELSAVNFITVQDRLAPKMTGPAAVKFCSECEDAAISTANLPAWLETLQDKFTLRSIIAASTNAIARAYEANDATAELDAFERDALKIRPARRDVKDIKTLLQEAQTIIEYRAQNWDKIIGLPTGLRDLDVKTDGLHRGEFIVIAALPSCGKTALAVNIGVHNSLEGTPVGILSAEMRPVQLVIRSICSESRVNYKRISETSIAPMSVAMGRMSKAPIHIQAVTGFTIGQCIAVARRMSQEHGIKLLVVDYIQLLAGVGSNREQQISSVGRGLKQIASELEIPVIGLSQLNDNGELRDSRAIGHDADSVWKLENDGAWQPEVQSVMLRIEKCRDGETGTVPLTFLKTFTRFECQVKTSQPEDWNDR